MSVRHKILLYFSIVTIALSSVALLFIYTLFSQYREQEFQQRQKDKIETTLKFLTEIKGIDQDLIESMDRITIHDIYDEKLLIFDKNKDLVYSSIADTPVSFSGLILRELSAKVPWIEEKDGMYDVVGLYMQRGDKAFYGISKAYDKSGYAKLNYLKYAISFTLLALSLIIVLISYYLSKRVTHSIFQVTRQIREFKLEQRNDPIVVSNTKDEIAILAQRFNELMHRMNEAFSFQKHAVHHISHELKTPIAVLVSDFEKIETEADIGRIKELIKIQKENTKSLSEIINSLLEIAKTESGKSPVQSNVRIDELIFDLMEEFNTIHPDFQFSVDYSNESVSDSNLEVWANEQLIKAALSNLMLNCVKYSRNNKAKIVISTDRGSLRVDFINHGATLTEKERQFMFQHFFRGENSKGKSGFGLGLVFINKILKLYGGEVSYDNSGIDINTFTISLPLSENLSTLRQS